MNWLNKLERKFGNWAIPNLIVWLIGAYTIGFVLYRVNPSIIGLLMLSPYHILHGQIWRLITWVFMPTDTNLVYLLIMALFYYQLGTTLERTWGTFRFNVYIFGGMLFTVIGAFLLYGIMYLMNGVVTTEMLLIGTSFSTSWAKVFACGENACTAQKRRRPEGRLDSLQVHAWPLKILAFSIFPPRKEMKRKRSCV